MASDMKLRKAPSSSVIMPPLMLKDFLRDDFSSCSSNGFKSFPRQQCCTTVRYLLERDLKSRDSNNNTKRLLKRSRSKAAASTTISALQRASEVVLNAVKHLPFSSVKLPSPSSSSSSAVSVPIRNRKGLLPRSFSRKLLKRSFWKRAEKEEIKIVRWKSFHEFLEEKQQPSDSIAIATAATTTTTTASSSTISNRNSNSWSSYLQFSSGNSECSGKNDAIEGKNKSAEEKKKVRTRVGVEVGEDSMEEEEASTATAPPPTAPPPTAATYSVEKKDWPSEEEKEQFSPVSVLDCPFDDEEEISYPFRSRLTQKLTHKIRRFENLAQLEPLAFEKRIASLSELDYNSAKDDSTTATFIEIEQEIKTEEKVEELLLKTKNASSETTQYKSSHKLLLDFFRDRVGRRYLKSDVKSSNDDVFEKEVLKVAKDWINGEQDELLLDWQVQDGRKAYLRDMEEREEWRKMDDDDEEKECVVLEVEVGVWASLVNELVLDLF